MKTIKYIGLAAFVGSAALLQLLLLAVVDHAAFERLVSGIRQVMHSSLGLKAS